MLARKPAPLVVFGLVASYVWKTQSKDSFIATDTLHRMTAAIQDLPRVYDFVVRRFCQRVILHPEDILYQSQMHDAELDHIRELEINFMVHGRYATCDKSSAAGPVRPQAFADYLLAVVNFLRRLNHLKKVILNFKQFDGQRTHVSMPKNPTNWQIPSVEFGPEVFMPNLCTVNEMEINMHRNTSYDAVAIFKVFKQFFPKAESIIFRDNSNHLVSPVSHRHLITHPLHTLCLYLSSDCHEQAILNALDLVFLQRQSLQILKLKLPINHTRFCKWLNNDKNNVVTFKGIKQLVLELQASMDFAQNKALVARAKLLYSFPRLERLGIADQEIVQGGFEPDFAPFFALKYTPTPAEELSRVQVSYHMDTLSSRDSGALINLLRNATKLQEAVIKYERLYPEEALAKVVRKVLIAKYYKDSDSNSDEEADEDEDLLASQILFEKLMKELKGFLGDQCFAFEIYVLQRVKSPQGLYLVWNSNRVEMWLQTAGGLTSGLAKPQTRYLPVEV